MKLESKKGASKADVAKKLTLEAQSLSDASGKNMVALGLICRQFKNDADLFKAGGFHTFDAWREDTFKSKLTTAKTSMRIVDKLLPIFPEDKVLEMGKVKATAYCRLPESEMMKQTWREWVFAEDSTTFKQRIKDFIGGKDHLEGFCQIAFSAPNSFRDETWKRVMEKGRNAEETTDTFIVLEAALAEYEQTIDTNMGERQVGTNKCFTRVHSTKDTRDAILTALRLSILNTGKDEDIIVLAALNSFNEAFPAKTSDD